jgi:hypothetical protein
MTAARASPGAPRAHRWASDLRATAVGADGIWHQFSAAKRRPTVDGASESALSSPLAEQNPER